MFFSLHPVPYRPHSCEDDNPLPQEWQRYPFFETNPLKIRGVIRVVAMTINMMTVYRSALIAFMLKPIEAMIIPTSPRGTIPNPTIKASFFLKFMAPRPNPRRFPKIAKTVIIRAAHKSAGLANMERSTQLPKITKKKGTRKLYRDSVFIDRLYSKFSPERTIPAKNAPTMAAKSM